MKQHFSAAYINQYGAFCVSKETQEAEPLYSPECLYVNAQNSEITRACINRIVDNLNKLAEHAAKNGGINEV